MTRYTKLYLHILIMFIGIFMMSYIAEHIHDLLGDWKCSGTGNYIKIGGDYHYEKCNAFGGATVFHNSKIHYGFRHWLLISLGLVLMIISIASMVEKFNKKEND